MAAQVRGSGILDVHPLSGSSSSNVTDPAGLGHDNGSFFGSLWGDDVNFTQPKAPTWTVMAFDWTKAGMPVMPFDQEDLFARLQGLYSADDPLKDDLTFHPALYLGGGEYGVLASNASTGWLTVLTSGASPTFTLATDGSTQAAPQALPADQSAASASSTATTATAVAISGSGNRQGGQGSGDGEDPRRPSPMPLPPDHMTANTAASQQEAAEAYMYYLESCTTPEVRELAANVQQRTIQWFNLRAGRLTASSVAAAAGSSFSTTAQQLARQKLAELQGFLQGGAAVNVNASGQCDPALAHGIANENRAAMAYFESSAFSVGTYIGNAGLYIHPILPWLAASPDFIVHHPLEGSSLLEVKCPFKRGIPIELPPSVRMQAIAQLACQPLNAGWRWVDVFYWTPTDSKTFRVHWNATVRMQWEINILPRLQQWFYTLFAPSAAGLLQPALHIVCSVEPPPQADAPPEHPSSSQEIGVGSRVWATNRKCEQHGTVMAQAGQPGKWIVSWDGVQQQRKTPIHESNLRLVFPNPVAPTAPGQRVKVILGANYNAEGVTVSKVGAKWSVKLNGASQAKSFEASYLHAIESPTPDALVFNTTGMPSLLTSYSVPIASFPEWLHNHQFSGSCPVDLRRRKPDNLLVYELCTQQTSISDLDERQVLGLAYLFQGGKENQKCLSPGEVRQQLAAYIQGQWRLKFVCSRGGFVGNGSGHQSTSTKKCGCPYALVAQHHAGSDYVLVSEEDCHQGHDPNSVESLRLLSLAPELEAEVLMMHQCGVRPWQIVEIINRRQRAGQLPAELHSANCTSASYLARFSNARFTVGVNQVKAIIQKHRRSQGLVGSDVVSLGSLMRHYSEQGCVLHYQAYSPSTESCEEQPVVIMISTPFQQRMLHQFGRRLAFLDATGGTNKYGYMFYTLLVQDDFGRGSPVAFMITSSETTEIIQEFIQKVAQAAQHAGDGEFEFKHIMIDKSKAEMAACSAEGIKYLLCYFHFLQDWERFLRSASSGVREAKDRHEIICTLRQLKEQRNEAVFKHAVETFLADMGRRYPSVATQYRANWQDCATHWAEWGRLDILDKNCHTNNLLERFFGNLKYALLDRKTQHSLTELCQKLVEEIAPAYVDRRCYMLAGRGTSTLATYQQRRKVVVESLLSTPGAIFAPTTAGAAPGQAIICQDGGTTHTTVLGDLSCTCGYSESHICYHLEAAHRCTALAPFSHSMREAAAEQIVRNKWLLVVNGTSGIYSCRTFAKPDRSVFFRPMDGFCTCNDWERHGKCCHLIAASSLSAQPLLPATSPLADGSVDVSSSGQYEVAVHEPLGDDITGELQRLRQAGEAFRQQCGASNADPLVAEVRSLTNAMQRCTLGLPIGASRDECLQLLRETAEKVRLLAAGAGLQPTATRAGKQQTKRRSRPENRRKEKPLYSSRKKLRLAAGAAAVTEFPTLPKRGQKSTKVRGLTIPGNIQGTTIRTGAHRRATMSKYKKRMKKNA